MRGKLDICIEPGKPAFPSAKSAKGSQMVQLGEVDLSQNK
jgi:hypothetical protein